MEMLSYACSKMASILKNRKYFSFIFFAILTFVSFINIPLAVAQEQNNTLAVSSNHKDSDNATASDTNTGANAAADTAKETKPGKKNFQRIIPLSSPLYREMDRLYLLAKKSRPSLSRPWSAEEAKKIMDALPEGLLDSAADSIAVIKREIEFGNEKTGAKNASFKASPEINIEGRIKTNDDRKEWEHGYEASPPLFVVPFEGWFFTN